MMTWKEIGDMFNMNKDAVRMKAARSGLNKEQIIDVLKEEQNLVGEELQGDINKTEQMERKLSRAPFTIRTFSSNGNGTYGTQAGKLDEQPTQNPENQANFVHPPAQKMEHAEHPQVNQNERIRERIEAWMLENTGKITTVLKSNFMSVTVMLTLSVVVAIVFTSRVAIAVGVHPVFSYLIAILVDASAIIFMFRGHRTLSWIFGLNIFMQIALTSDSTIASKFLEQDTILGLKILLLAVAVLTAIEGFSSLSSQNKD